MRLLMCVKDQAGSVDDPNSHGGKASGLLISPRLCIAACWMYLYTVCSFLYPSISITIIHGAMIAHGKKPPPPKLRILYHEGWGYRFEWLAFLWRLSGLQLVLDTAHKSTPAIYSPSATKFIHYPQKSTSLIWRQIRGFVEKDYWNNPLRSWKHTSLSLWPDSSGWSQILRSNRSLCHSCSPLRLVGLSDLFLMDWRKWLFIDEQENNWWDGCDLLDVQMLRCQRCWSRLKRVLTRCYWLNGCFDEWKCKCHDRSKWLSLQRAWVVNLMLMCRCFVVATGLCCVDRFVNWMIVFIFLR